MRITTAPTSQPPHLMCRPCCTPLAVTTARSFRRTWFVCDGPSEGLECEKDASIAGQGYICKEPAK